jgi:hypothetical protein
VLVPVFWVNVPVVDAALALTLSRVPKAPTDLGHEGSDGTVVLVPAVVMPESEARLLVNPELVAQIERTIAEPETRFAEAARGERTERWRNPRTGWMSH